MGPFLIVLSVLAVGASFFATAIHACYAAVLAVWLAVLALYARPR